MRNTQKISSYITAILLCFAALPASAQVPHYIPHTANMPASLHAFAGGAQVSCNGDSVVLGGTPAAIGGNGPYTWAWSPATGLSSATVSNPSAAPAASTGYTLTVTDTRNCTASSQAQINASALNAAFTYSASGLAVNFTGSGPASVMSWNWDFGDGGTSSLQNPGHTYAANGNFTVCLSLRDSLGCTDTTCQTLSVAVGRELNTADNTFRVYPNPAKGWVIAEIVPAKSGNALLSLTDINGRTLQSFEQKAESGKLIRQSFGVPAAGMYFIRYEDASGSTIRKVISE